jgi:hypothetical protein
VAVTHDRWGGRGGLRGWGLGGAQICGGGCLLPIPCEPDFRSSQMAHSHGVGCQRAALSPPSTINTLSTNAPLKQTLALNPTKPKPPHQPPPPKQRYFLDNVAGWILELDRGQGIPFEGNYSGME